MSSEVTYTDSSDTSQTFIGNPIVIILNSDTDLQIKNEISSDDKERERHDITWIINNTFHPLKNIIVSADIYGDTTWTGPSSTSAGTVQFDPNSKHLIWNIPEMTENTDVLTLPFSVVINKKNPTQNTLISKVHLIAEDTVSGKKIEIISDEIPLK
ncbi:MAG: hypothetical protein ACD_72C00334G0003 [uncultured bacterium]|nr:MAG: hypothetical protein ACD_72C00334G0003 [uncultured bacterium]